MHRVGMVLMCGIMLLLIFVVQTSAAGSENSDPNSDLLKILHENKAITDAQYQELSEQILKKKKNTDIKVQWKNGFRLSSEDKAFDVKFVGRILNDWAVINADQELDNAFGDTLLEGSGTEFRQARIEFSGTIYNDIIFRAEYDFAGGDADFKDVWVGMKKIPHLGQIRFGHQKEPFSLEQLNNVMYLVFMEKGLVSALVPNRNTGVKIINSTADKKLAWSLSIMKDVDDTGDGFKDGSDYNFTGRISGVPINSNSGRNLLHLGLSYSHQFRKDDNTLRLRERPETHITDVRLADTGNIPGVDAVDLLGGEIGFIRGSLSLQSEYVYAMLSSQASDDPEFSSWYIFCSYFLTGENRAYRLDDGGGEFTRVKIKNDFHLNKPGWGAWEIALRYSMLDLNDNGIKGGKETNWTLGLNWYLNPNLRWDLNYVLAKIEDRDSGGVAINEADTNILMTRFQIYF
ncbi:MAG: porin [Desulfobacteraceae bacterium]|jgi:phosphate-selective porin OprO/OprP